jgi:8-oxo-dGTP pyrophosphatase MutT (NUDIX family)
MDAEPAEITFAAGVIAKALTTGRILMVKRTDTGEWAFPGGRLEDGEDAAQAAYREFVEETQYRLGSVGKELMRRQKDDGAGLVNFVTFLAPVEDEFVPKLDYEHSSFAWVDADEMFSETRPVVEAVADSAEGQDAPENPPMLNNQGDGFDEPADEDNISDEDADLILSVIEDLEARLERIEGDLPEVSRDDNDFVNATPVQGGETHAELAAALEERVADWDDDCDERDDRKAAQRLGTRFRSV